MAWWNGITDKWPRWVLGGLVLAVVGLTLALLFLPRPITVEVESVRRGPIADSVSAEGTARLHEAYVIAAPVTGRLERIELHVGDRVTAGQTMVARIRPLASDLLDARSRLQAQAMISAAEAGLSSALAQRDQAVALAGKTEADLRRIQTLAERGFASNQALEDAQAAARIAQSAVRALTAQTEESRAALNAARASLLDPEIDGLGMVRVTAPTSGYVTRVLQQSARTVAAGVPLVEVGDQGGLEAAIEFLSQDAVRIREGMPAEVYDWGGTGTLPAMVRRVEPQGFTKISALGVEEQRVVVVLQFTGASRAWSSLGPGYRLSGRVFLRRQPKALKAPLGALVRSGEQWAVYQVVGGRARLIPVRIGAMTDQEAEILEGLKQDDRVVVFPSDKVQDGVRVAEN